MSSCDTPLPKADEAAILPDVSDEDCQRDVGEIVQATSAAPAGCWAGEAEFKPSDQTRADLVEAVPVGCWADDGEEKSEEVAEVGSLSPSALGGPSDNSQNEPKTAAEAIKSQRDFEAFLRASGFSRAASKALARGGWNAFDKAEAAEEDTVELDEQLGHLIRLLREP